MCPQGVSVPFMTGFLVSMGAAMVALEAPYQCHANETT
jgi:hypothetical protein